MNGTNLLRAVEKFASLTQPLSGTDLEREWSWMEYSEGVRFAFFRVYEELRQLAARLGTIRANSDYSLTNAQRTLAQYHSAYRDLQAILLGISDENALHSPAEDEWPVREVLIHVIAAERAFFAVNFDALERVRTGDGRPLEMSEEAWQAIWVGDTFDQHKESAPSSELLAYYGELHRRVLGEFAGITEDELSIPAVFWESSPMTVEFRLHRFDAHLRQHTVQAEKTLEAIGFPLGEAKRLLRLIYAALAEAEGPTIGAWDLGLEKQEMVANQIAEYTNEIAKTLSG